LRGIRHLLYGEGYTIKGVQRILKEQGPRFVMQVWREDGVPLATLAAQAAAAEPAPPAAKSAERVGREPAQASRPSPSRPAQAPVARHQGEVADIEGEPVPRGILAEGVAPPEAPQARAGFRLMERLLGERGEAMPAGNLSKDDIRRLQATLFELLECKRILDQAR
jgi:hypothetical protein